MSAALGSFVSSRRELDQSGRQKDSLLWWLVAWQTSDAEEEHQQKSAEHREQQRETFFRLLHGAAPSLR